MKKLFPALAVAVVFATPCAHAQFAKPEDAAKYRQSVMFVMQTHLGTVAAMAQGRIPFDAKVAADSAAVVELLSKHPWMGFTPGSDKVSNTRAKPEIWNEPGKFKEEGDKMQAEAAKLGAAAKSGNLDAIKSAVGNVGGACKSCHDSFRSRS